MRSRHAPLLPRRSASADVFGRRRALICLLATLAAAVVAALPSGRAMAAGTSDAPPPRVGAHGTVLTVVVLGGAGKTRSRHDFDLMALAALPQRTLVATTPWHGATHRFTGPLLRDVLAAGANGAAGAGGQRLTAIALNDYRVEIPLEDSERWPVIVALQVDERPVAVREKGPLMLMYPFDDDRSLRQARYYGRAVWQLRTLELR